MNDIKKKLIKIRIALTPYVNQDEDALEARNLADELIQEIENKKSLGNPAKGFGGLIDAALLSPKEGAE